MKIYYNSFDHHKVHVDDGQFMTSSLTNGIKILNTNKVILLGRDKAHLTSILSNLTGNKNALKFTSNLPTKILIEDLNLTIEIHSERSYKNTDTRPTEKHIIFMPLLNLRLIKECDKIGLCESLIGTAEENCPCTWDDLKKYLTSNNAVRI